MSFEELFGNFNPGGKQQDAELKARIVKIEQRLDSHDAAFKKINELLKECIRRIEEMKNGR